MKLAVIGGAVVIALAALLTLVLAAPASRAALVSFGLRFALSQHGYHLAGGDFALNHGTLTVNDLRIKDDRGDVFLAAKKVTVHFDPAGLIGRSDRRFGLRSLVLEEPRVRLIRRGDGSWNFEALLGRRGPVTVPPAQPPRLPTPFHFRAVVQRGEVEIIDPLAAAPGRAFALAGISAWLSMDQGARSSGELNGALHTSRGDTMVRATLFENDAVSFARATISAEEVPIAPLVDGFAPSTAYAIETGLGDVRLQAYAIDYSAGTPDWHLSGDATVRSMRLRVIPLIVPVRDLAGRVHYQDGLLSTSRLSGTAAGVPLTAEGALRLAGGLRFALAVTQRGSLAQGRALLAFSQNRPLSGPFQLAIRIDGPLDELHTAGAFAAQNARYANGILRSLRGSFFYDAGHLTVSALDVAYGDARLWVDGDIDLNAPELNAQILLQAVLPSSEVPLVANVNPNGTASGFASLAGPIRQLSGSGYAQLSGGNGNRMRTFFHGGPQDVSLGPLLYRAGDGEMMLEASVTRSPNGPPALSGELIASHVGLHVHGGVASLADVSGVSVGLPSLDTVLNGEVFVDGGGALPEVAINVRASRLKFAGLSLGDTTLIAAGRNGRVHVARATLNGGDTQATARGDFMLTRRMTVAAAALQGSATADLSAFTPAFPSLRPRGITHGSFFAVLLGDGWIFEAQAHSADASIAGVPVRSGAALFDGSDSSTSLLANVRAPYVNLSAVGHVSNARLAHGAASELEAFAPNIDLVALKGFGFPLTGGSAAGFATLRGQLSRPDVDAAAAVRASYDNVPVSFDLDVRYANNILRSTASRVAFDGNQTTVNGSVSGLQPGASGAGPAMALNVRVREGDLAALNRFTGRSPLSGAFDADVRIGGSSSALRLDGYIDTDLGTVRGVAFNELHGSVHVRPGYVALNNASVQLGSSQFALDGDASRHAFRVSATSPHVDMADFNDFFGGTDVFAGTGSFHMQLASNGKALAAGGNFLLDDAALRDYPLGHIETDFSSQRGGLRAVVRQDGPAGASVLSGTVRFREYRSGRPNFGSATYNVKAKLRNVEVDQALPLIHQEDLGLSGKLDADGTIVGTLQKPTGKATVVLRNGHLRRVPIDSFEATLAGDAGGVTLSQAGLKLPYLTAQGEGRYTFAGRRIVGSATLQAADLASVAAALRAPGTLGGGAKAGITVSGTLARPRAVVSLDAGQATLYGIAFDQAKIHATYAPGELSIGDTSLIFAGHRGQLSIAGQLPLQLQPLALGPKDRSVALAMRAERIDLGVLNPLVRRFATLEGRLDAAATISGSAGNPLGKGSAQLRNASVRSPLQTVPLTDASADLAFERDTITLRQLHGRVGSGSIDAQGAAHIVPAVGLRSNAGLQLWSRVSLHDAQIDVPQWIRGKFDGDLSLTRSGVTPYLAGTVAVSGAAIPFSAINELATGGAAAVTQSTPGQAPGVPPLRPGHTIVYGGGIWGGKTSHTLTEIGAPQPASTGLTLPPVDLNVAVNAGKDVRVRGGSAVDLTASGGIVIAGNSRAPTLNGGFTAIRGQVGYFDTTFRLVSGKVTFDPAQGLLPTLDATAVTNIGGEQITLTLSGRVDNLSTDLSADPPLTRDQIVATLLHAPQVASLSNATPQQAQATLISTAESYFNAQLSRSLLYPFESALAEQLNIEQISLIFDQQGNIAVEVRTRFTPTITAVYQSTLSVPFTQSYGVSYRLRDYLALELLQARPNPTNAYGNAALNLRYAFH